MTDYAGALYFNDLPSFALGGVISNSRYQQPFTLVERLWTHAVDSSSGVDEFARATLLETQDGRSWITTFISEVDRIQKLPDNWDSFGSAAPNQRAKLATYEVLDLLWDAGKEPTRIAPTVDEGFTIWLSELSQNIQLSIDCLNTGEIHAEIVPDNGQTLFKTEQDFGGIEQVVDFLLEQFEQFSPAIADVQMGQSSGSEFSTE